MTNQSSQALTACVFCGSRPGADPRFCDIAALTGKALAERGINVVFGGGNSGLMGIVSQTALQGGVRVTGVIPEFLKSKEPPADNLTRLITVADMHERKRTMADLSDFFIALPGGIGTFEEIFEVITNNTIGVFNKPAGFFNFDGYYDTLFQFMDQSAQTSPTKSTNLLICLLPKLCVFEKQKTLHKCTGFSRKRLILLIFSLARKLPLKARCILLHFGFTSFAESACTKRS